MINIRKLPFFPIRKSHSLRYNILTETSNFGTSNSGAYLSLPES